MGFDLRGNHNNVCMTCKETKERKHKRKSFGKGGQMSCRARIAFVGRKKVDNYSIDIRNYVYFKETISMCIFKITVKDGRFVFAYICYPELSTKTEPHECRRGLETKVSGRQNETKFCWNSDLF